MTGFALLDVAIGVLFTFLTFSLVASAIQEALASVLNWRGRILRRGLFRILEGTAGHATELVNVTWLTPARLKKAETTLDFLADPSIKALHGPKSFLGQIWDWLFAWRKTDLEKTLTELGRLPSAIPKDTFASALLNMLKKKIDLSAVKADDGLTSDNAAAVIAATRALGKELAEEADKALRTASGVLEKLPMNATLKSKLRRTVLKISVQEELQRRLDRLDTIAADVQTEIEERAAKVETQLKETLAAVGAWFDASMDRVTGWYVRRAKYMLFVIGTLMACVVNFDVIGYSGQLLKDTELRQRIVAQAQAAVAAESVGGLAIQRQAALINAVLLLNTDDDRPTISAAELEAGLAKLDGAMRTGLGFDANPDTAPTDPQKAAALERLNKTLASMVGAFPTDRNEDGKIDDDERRQAADDYVANVKAEFGNAVDVLNTQFADQGVTMGRTCPDRPVPDVTGVSSFVSALWASSWTQCVLDQWQWQAFLSWILIGFGCTMGGQFWFNLLKQLLKARETAANVAGQIQQLSGGSAQPGGQPATRGAGA